MDNSKIEQDSGVEQIEPRQSLRGVFPTWGDLLAILGIFFLGQVMAQFAISFFSLAEELASDGGYRILLSTSVALPLTLLFMVVYRRFRGGSKGNSIHYSFRGFDPTILLWGVVMLLSLVVVIEPLMVLLPDPPQVQYRGVYLLIAVVVVAPIFEELICRGVILESLRAKRGAWAACVISSLIFGLIHVYPQSVFNAFVIGLLLGYIYLRTNSIFASIFIHAINNLLSYLLLIFGLSDVTLSEMVSNHSIYMIIYISACSILLFSFIGMSRYITALDKADRRY